MRSIWTRWRGAKENDEMSDMKVPVTIYKIEEGIRSFVADDWMFVEMIPSSGSVIIWNGFEWHVQTHSVYEGFPAYPKCVYVQLYKLRINDLLSDSRIGEVVMGLIEGKNFQ